MGKNFHNYNSVLQFLQMSLNTDGPKEVDWFQRPTSNEKTQLLLVLSNVKQIIN